jgi:nicotinamidase/pyrazinamidase
MIGALVVDIQGDFTQLMGGALAVPGTGLDYLNKINRAVEQLKDLGIPVWASQDWHPADHVSFFTSHPGKKGFEKIVVEGREQILWPPHCVQETSEAELLLDPSLFAGIIQKGSDPGHDSYSCFADDGGRETELDGILKAQGIKKLLLFGLATDYCVKWTALDGRKRGYGIVVVQSLCRGVDPVTSAQALKEIKGKGAVILEDLETFIALQG